MHTVSLRQPYLRDWEFGSRRGWSFWRRLSWHILHSYPTCWTRGRPGVTAAPRRESREWLEINAGLWSRLGRRDRRGRGDGRCPDSLYTRQRPGLHLHGARCLLSSLSRLPSCTRRPLGYQGCQRRGLYIAPETIQLGFSRGPKGFKHSTPIFFQLITISTPLFAKLCPLSATNRQSCVV